MTLPVATRHISQSIRCSGLSDLDNLRDDGLHYYHYGRTHRVSYVLQTGLILGTRTAGCSSSPQFATL